MVETEPVSYHANADCMAALRRSNCYIDQHDASGMPLALKDGSPLDPVRTHACAAGAGAVAAGGGGWGVRGVACAS